MIEELRARFGTRVRQIQRSQWRHIYVVGDIHGCAREFKRLLEKLELSDDDLVICVGDVIRKGPDSAGALKQVRKASNIISILGNSELNYLRRDSPVPDLRKRDRAFIHRWPLLVVWDETVVVHAGIHPHRPIARLTVEDMLHMRSLKHGDLYRPPYWFEEYTGTDRIFFGHTVTHCPILRSNVVGLDTGCVYGGRLTAYDCTRRHCVSIESKDTYRQRSATKYYDAAS